MRNLVIVTPTGVNKDMLRAFVASWNGYWHEQPTLNQGVIQRGRATIFLSIGADLAEEYEPDELLEFARILGKPPQADVDIHIGHEPHSDSLATEVADAIIARWGGVIAGRG